ncbi:response regulator [Pseudomonas yamanorum]|uniref:response regulator n=1 Tax=Pseudomonas yamanorum TaxID=515393 RepID=UPI003D35E19C
MRILIVEDEPILAMLTAETLEEGGHEVVGPAHDESEARSLASQFEVDVAFVDINLNGHEEGIQVAKFLREHHGIFSIFVSGQAVAARERGQESIGVLSKPYTLDDLLNTALIVKSWLAGEQLPNRIPRTLEIFAERPSKP